MDGVTVTFEQGLTWAIRIAQYLKKRGLNYKDVIGIAAKNSTYVMPLGVACLMNATPFHAVNPVLDQGKSGAKGISWLVNYVFYLWFRYSDACVLDH